MQFGEHLIALKRVYEGVAAEHAEVIFPNILNHITDGKSLTVDGDAATVSRIALSPDRAPQGDFHPSPVRHTCSGGTRPKTMQPSGLPKLEVARSAERRCR
jgi:hypothetical protein